MNSPPRQTLEQPSASRSVAVKHFISRHRAPFVLLGATLFIITLMSIFKTKPPVKPVEERSWPIQALQVAPQTLTPQLRLLGRIETPYQSSLSAQVTATVKTLNAQEGARVSAGNLLIALDDSETSLLLAQREADVAEIKAQRQQELNQQQADLALSQRESDLVAIAQRSVDRENKLAKSSLSSQARLDDASRNLQTAQLSLIQRQLSVSNQTARLKALDARLQRAEALLAQARLDLDHVQIRAPFDGVVSSLKVSPGERVRPGDPLLDIYNDRQLEVRAQLPMKWVAIVQAALSKGQTLTAQLISNGATIHLLLARLSGQVSNNAGGIDAFFSVPAAAGSSGIQQGLALNQTLELRLSLPALNDVYAVPVSAIYGTQHIFTIQEGRLRRLEVTLVGETLVQGRQLTLFKSSQLQPGDRVCITQLPNAVNGLKVDIREANGGDSQAAAADLAADLTDGANSHE